MMVSVPIWIQEHAAPAGETLFIAEPLFHRSPQERGVKLSRVLSRLTSELQKVFTELGKEPRHDTVTEWIQTPALDTTHLELRLEIKSGTAIRPFLLVGWSAMGRRLFYTPSIPELRFEVSDGQSLEDRAQNVIERHLRNLERDGQPVALGDIGLKGKAWLAYVEVSFEPSHKIQAPKKSIRALLGGGEAEKPDGPAELQRTSRRLNELFPDDLERAVGRETEVSELLGRLSSNERRPLLLLGPRKAGKTAIVHETVWRMESEKRRRAKSAQQKSAGPNGEELAPRAVWHVSPMRLISGMSYLGQWENRVLAILDHAAARDLVLYIDDLLGLFSAGISAQSDLNVAAVFKPFLERKDVRVLAEITPEAWRILRERDRGFAELFQVVPVREMTQRETLEVLITFARELESRHHCHFSHDVVPLTLDLHRRFIRDAAFPGKAAGFLRRLAARASGKEVGRNETLEEFQQQSGLMIALLNDRKGLGRPWILEALGRQLAGQPMVLEAFADTIALLKARLNDPTRPLATFLLLGPTGVGKTQSAKALAQYLFGSSQRLLRFDMNEYGQASSVMRLAGTPSEPEGLLTSAVRRQPFCVVLFDEIEKAAPEVFDLLLAVLDEGRLTDALGRVADFTNSIILLTSNLGAREARTTAGFGSGTIDESAIYRSAAERFFRPEFFNRIDRILPFQGLSTADLQQIAERLISEVFARQGLRQRDCLLNVSEEAKGRLVELGRHPQLGARALKRVVERELAQPIAERLASMVPGYPMRVGFHFDGTRFELALQEIRPAPRTANWSDHIPLWLERKSAGNLEVEGLLDQVRITLDRIEERLDAIPTQERLEVGHVPPAQAKAIFCREQLREADHLLKLTEALFKPSRKKSIRVLNTARARTINLSLVRKFYVGDPRPDSIRAAESLRFDLNEIHEPEEATELPDSPLAALLREVALLEIMMAAPDSESPVTLAFYASQPSEVIGPLRVALLFQKALEKCWGFTVQRVWPSMRDPTEYYINACVEKNRGLCFPALVIQGPGARAWLSTQTGIHLHRAKDGGLSLFQAHLLDLTTVESARATFDSWPHVHTSTSQALPTISESVEGRGYINYRSGLRLPDEPSAEEWRASLLSALPLSFLGEPAKIV